MFVKSVEAPPRGPRPQLPPELAARVRPVASAASRLLPLPPELASLFPDRALRRGSATVVSGLRGGGVTTLALSLLGAASGAGHWSAAVGIADPGVVSIAELGIDLRRFAMVPCPRGEWAEAAAVLLDGLDAVVVRPFGRAALTPARHLVTRARDRNAALVVVVDHQRHWPEVPDVALQVLSSTWEGIGCGHGYLCERRAEVEVAGRRHRGAPERHRLCIPAAMTPSADRDGGG